jgi:TRAP-type C4-dicarboxylate transport system permease small subunit
MKRLLSIWHRVGKSTQILAGIILLVMFIMTLMEVAMRFLWRPIPGTYELISFLGGLVIGFSVPFTSQNNGHVNVDFMIERASTARKSMIIMSTRIIVMAFFLLIGGSLVLMGIDLHGTKEVSQTLKVPYYPVAIGLGLGFLIQAVQFCLDIFVIYGGRHE